MENVRFREGGPPCPTGREEHLLGTPREGKVEIWREGIKGWEAQDLHPPREKHTFFFPPFALKLLLIAFILEE